MPTEDIHEDNLDYQWHGNDVHAMAAVHRGEAARPAARGGSRYGAAMPRRRDGRGGSLELDPRLRYQTKMFSL
eukprot:8179278-Pyramimonas_sp.AAC.1